MLRATLLGRFALTLNDAALPALDTPASRRLLAYLMLHCREPVARQHAAFTLYPDTRSSQAQTNLRHALHRLRACWPADPVFERFVQITPRSIHWRGDASSDIDALAFESAIQRGDLDRAIALYHGDLLPGDTTEWLALERDRLRTTYLNALAALTERDELSATARAIDTAERLMREEPLRESAYQLLMRLHARTGDLAAVRRTYDLCESTLRDELGIEPAVETRTAQAHALAIAQHTRPALRVRGAPEHATAFVSREVDLAALGAWITERRRLITLHAPGGMGKTRLLIEALRANAERFSDGAAFITFEDTSDARQVLPRIAAMLDIALNSAETPLDQLCARLRNTSLLLGLDNVETVLDAGFEIAALLAACPGLHIIATSRAPLSVTWEWLYDLRGLDDGASTLFERTAERVNPAYARDTARVMRICELVEGMPLAIELAAARVRDMSLSSIVQAIDESVRFLRSPFHDTPERQRSVHAVIDWTWRLLSDDERALLRRLSVCRGGATADTAAAMMRLDASTVDRLLTASAAHLLIRRDAAAEGQPEARFRMHSLVQQFAHDALIECGDAPDAHARHFELMHAIAEHAEPLVLSSNAANKRDAALRLNAESENLRAALDWSIAHSPDDGLALAHLLFEFWQRSGRAREARQYFEALLTRASQAPSRERARALNRLGVVAMFAADYEASLDLLAQACTTYTQIGDEAATARPLCNMIIAARHQGDYPRTLALARQVTDMLGAEPPNPDVDRFLIPRSVALINSAYAAAYTGDRAAALDSLAQAMAIFERIPDPYHLRTEQASRGGLLLWLGEYASAHAAYLDSLDFALSVDARAVVASCIDGCAGIAAETGSPEPAAQLFGLAARIRRELGIALPRVCPTYERPVKAARAALGPDAFDAAYAKGLNLPIEAGVALARNALGTLAERARR
jgi:predicted ATPase/DNA-binding SARP family transcriptional activator